MAAILLARAAVWYSIRHRVFSCGGMSRRTGSRSILGRGSALVVPLCLVAPLGGAGQLRGGAGKRERPS
jgi:hypothetical protein